MAHGQAGDFGWFTAWGDGYLGVCVTFARGLSWKQMLEGFGVRPGQIIEETFYEADADLDRPKVRVGVHEGWGYAVEHFTSRGAHEDTLCRLSTGGGEALALTYTQTISAFNYAANGEYVSGFDLVVPHIRWGTDPRRFDATMAQAGFLEPGVPEPWVMGARFVRLTCGITLTQELLEQRLPSFDVSQPPPMSRERPLPPSPPGEGWHRICLPGILPSQGPRAPTGMTIPLRITAVGKVSVKVSKPRSEKGASPPDE
jgi:hypothetical protein